MKKILFIVFIILFIQFAMFFYLPVYDMKTECLFFNGYRYDNFGSTPCVRDKVVARAPDGLIHSLICGKAYSIKGDKELYYIYVHEDGMTGGLYAREDAPDPQIPTGVFWGRVQYYQDSDMVDMAEKLSSVYHLYESDKNGYIDTEIYVDRTSSDISHDAYPLYLCYDGIAVGLDFVGYIYKYNDDYYLLNTRPNIDSSEENRCYKIDKSFYNVLDKYWDR